jgi:hypothetical protein
MSQKIADSARLDPFHLLLDSTRHDFSEGPTRLESTRRVLIHTTNFQNHLLSDNKNK